MIGRHNHCRRVQRVPVVIAALLALGCAGIGALAPATRLSAQAPMPAPGARAGAAGVWLVHPDQSNPAAQELAVLSPDGLMFASETPSMPQDPSQRLAGMTQLFSSQGYGVWQPNGERTIAFKFLEIAYDQNGDYAGLTSIHGNLTLNDARDAFAGAYTVTVTTASGTSMDLISSAPLTGTRVTVDSSP